MISLNHNESALIARIVEFYRISMGFNIITENPFTDFPSHGYRLQEYLSLRNVHKMLCLKQNQCIAAPKVLKPLGYYQNDGAQKISAANTNPMSNVEY